MTSTTFFIIFIPILAIILLAVNLILAPHNPYQEKDSVFECGFHSFLGQNRTQFSISFFIFALLFLLFDLEILLVYPFSVSGYNNDIYGLVIMLVFFLALTLGFVFELGKNALSIESKQTISNINRNIPKPHGFINLPLYSDMGISEIVKELTTLLPQLANFINQFNTTVSASDINVVTDSIGNMSIDVPKDMAEDVANKLSTKINIIDRLITTRNQEINDLLQKGIQLENKLKMDDPNYVSQLADKIEEIRRLSALYKH